MELISIYFIAITFCLTFVTGSLAALESEEELLSYLFRGYNALARPVLNSSQTVSVNLRFSLLQIQDLNMRSEVLTTTGLLVLDWIDERLTWDESISDLEEIVVHGGTIWRPEFAVINGAESIYGEYHEFQAVLKRNGQIRWEPGGVFRTMCPIDVTFYPFDEQTCHLVFGAWSYYTTKMNLTTDRPDGIDFHAYETNGELEIIGTSVHRNEFHFNCCPDELFSNINFSLALRRRHEFYVMNVVLPGVLTSAVLLTIFYCIPSQKVHIGVAALLSFRLFLLNVADSIPRTSDNVPLLGVYLTCTLTITTLAMVATVFVGNLYETKDRPVPQWARTAFLHYAARLLGYCTRCVDPPPGFDRSITRGPDEDRRPPGAAYRLVALMEDADYHPQLHVGHGSSENIHGFADEIYRSKCSSAPDVRVIDRGGTTGGGSSAVDDMASYAKDWENVAAVCDRMFFWLCLILTLVTAIVLFHPVFTTA